MIVCYITISTLFTQNTFADSINESEISIHIATFDSGFGGLFTAEAIESKAVTDLIPNRAVRVTISHFGDTANAPYGERTQEEIAKLTANHVLDAINKGADKVFIACNTASTQYDAIIKNIAAVYPDRSKDIISIINASAKVVYDKVQDSLANKTEVFFALYSTPATLSAGSYPKSVATLFGAKLSQGPIEKISQPRWLADKNKTIISLRKHDIIELSNGKKVHLLQVAPANWVDMIEHGASDTEQSSAVHRDMLLLSNMLTPKQKIIGLAEFCTHYPVFDYKIRQEVQQMGIAESNTVFITQGAIMANEFYKYATAITKQRVSKLSESGIYIRDQEAKPTVTVSGNNIASTLQLANKIFGVGAIQYVHESSEYPRF